MGNTLDAVDKAYPKGASCAVFWDGNKSITLYREDDGKCDMIDGIRHCATAIQWIAPSNWKVFIDGEEFSNKGYVRQLKMGHHSLTFKKGDVTVTPIEARSSMEIDGDFIEWRFMIPIYPSTKDAIELGTYCLIGQMST